MWAKEKREERTDCNLWVQQTYDKAQDPQTDDRHNIKVENGGNHKKADLKLLKVNDPNDIHTIKNLLTDPNPKLAIILHYMLSLRQRHWRAGYLFNKIDSAIIVSCFWGWIQLTARKYNLDVASRVLGRDSE